MREWRVRILQAGVLCSWSSSAFGTPSPSPRNWACAPSSPTATSALGKLYQRMGARDRAQEHLTAATTMYREMGMNYWLEQARRN